MKYAPVIIPTLCRFEHFFRCIESLKNNGWASFTDVFIGLDYPPEDKYRPGWEQIKEYLKSSDFSVFASFTVLERDKNMGAVANFKAIMGYVVSLGYDRWIAAEDDLEFSPNFIEYVDKCLDYYESDPDVVGVTGYSYPVKWHVSNEASCFKQKFNASTWGTGYWLEKYQHMESYMENKGLKKAVRKVVKGKLYEDMIDTAKIEYFNEAFSVVSYLKINWMRLVSDIGMRAFLAVENKFFVTPIISKTRNHGFDGSGVNTKNTKGSLRDHSLRPIDKKETFELVADQLCDYQENKNKMNFYEMRTSRDMRLTNILIWLASHIGIWLSKTVVLALIPFDIMKKVMNKLFRK